MVTMVIISVVWWSVALFLVHVTDSQDAWFISLNECRLLKCVSQTEWTDLWILLLKMTTRQATEIYGLGSGITEADSDITGAKLPTSMQVLRCMMYHVRNTSQISKWDAAKIVLSKVAIFYGKGNIPMISERKACEKIIKLLDTNNKLRAIPVARRSTPSVQAKITAENHELSQTSRCTQIDAVSSGQDNGREPRTVSDIPLHADRRRQFRPR